MDASNSKGSSSQSSRRPSSAEEFPSTIWMRVEQAKEATTPQSREALAELCEAYWHPVYAFIRRKGNDPDRAADLTQGFFTVIDRDRSLDGRHAGEREISLLPDGRLHALSLQPENPRAR